MDNSGVYSGCEPVTGVYYSDAGRKGGLSKLVYRSALTDLVTWTKVGWHLRAAMYKDRGVFPLVKHWRHRRTGLAQHGARARAPRWPRRPPHRLTASSLRSPRSPRTTWVTSAFHISTVTLQGGRKNDRCQKSSAGVPATHFADITASSSKPVQVTETCCALLTLSFLGWYGVTSVKRRMPQVKMCNYNKHGDCIDPFGVLRRRSPPLPKNCL